MLKSNIVNFRKGKDEYYKSIKSIFELNDNNLNNEPVYTAISDGNKVIINNVVYCQEI
jgi:hypothetical protein